MIQFIKFSKSYSNFLVLQIGDLLMEPGIYWIRGANGSGKSTLLKTMAGMLAFEGDILLNSISIKKQPVAYRKLVNFAEAEPIFPEFLSGREMISVFTSAKDAPAGQEDYFIESMKMQAYIDRPLATYSSGMLKKLSIVLAFMGNPEVILLDEPLITVDSESLKTLYRWISEKHERDGTSFFLSSHQDLNHEMRITSKEVLVDMKTLRFGSDVSAIN